MVSQLRRSQFWQRHGQVLLPLAVMDRQQPLGEVESMHAQFRKLRDPQAATVEQLLDQVIRRLELSLHNIHLAARKHHGDIRAALPPHHALHLAELPSQRMAVKEQQRVECLVLG
ncbi:MAG TPA: hypothetical protein DEW46_13015 [Verrucomicrobia bacterium]|nr:hypothetical protein [Verrucomicrobiota bacterium]